MTSNTLNVSKTMLELDDAIAQLRAHDEKTECCTFCNKPRHEVNTLVPGPNSIFICDQCVERAAKLIGQRT